MIKDNYIKKFVDYCKQKYSENLEAIIVFGSYSLDFFNERESDYDVIIVFKNKVPIDQEEIKKNFNKISLHHFLNEKDLLKKIYEGRWSIYITLLKSSKVLYQTKEYISFLKKLKKLNFLKETDNLNRFKFKDKIDRKHLKEVNKHIDYSDLGKHILLSDNKINNSLKISIFLKKYYTFSNS